MTTDILDIYTDYLISQNHHATATGLSALVDGEISHDKVTRFLNQNEFDSKDLWQYVKVQLRQQERETGGVLILDDAIEEKPYTDENEIVAWHFSHAKGRCVKGINILSSVIRYGDIALPIGFEVIRKDIHFCDLVTKKEKKQSSTTKNQHFRSLVQQAVTNHVNFDYVLADNWFGAKDNMEFIHYEKKKFFIFGIKSNRLIAFSADEKKKGQYRNLKSCQFQDGEKRIVYLKELAFPVALITRIFKNEDGTTGILHIVTNDLRNDADQIYDIYQKRWRIEEYHKSIKQNTSLEKSPTRTIRAQKNHIFASIVSYCKLEYLKVKTNLNHFALKYKLILKANMMAFKELKLLQKKVDSVCVT